MIAFDTNIIIYGFQDHPKSEWARELSRRATAVGSILALQVIGEFANACRKKKLLPHSELSLAVGALLAGFRIAPTTPIHVAQALTCAERYQLNYFDALIAIVSKAAGVAALLSEDMQDGLVIDTLTILNPFNPSNRDRIEALLESSL